MTALSIGARADEITMQLPLNTGGILLGTGINTLSLQDPTQLVQARCIEFVASDAGDKTNLSGQPSARISFTMKEINEEHEIETVLNASAAAKGNAVVDGITAKSEIEGHYRTVKKDSTTDKFAVIVIDVDLGATTSIGIPQPTKEALEAVKRGTSYFFDICGDGFVSSFSSRASFIGSVGVKTRDKNTLKAWDATHKGEVKFTDLAGGESNAHVDKTVTEKFKSFALDTRLLVNGQLKTAVVTSADELRAAATDFITEAQAGKAVPTAITVLDYGSVAALANEAFLATRDIRPIMDRFGELKKKSLAQEVELQQLREHPDWYDKEIDAQTFQSWAQLNAAYQDELELERKACATDPENKCTKTIVVGREGKFPVFEMPAKIKEIRRDPLCGTETYEQKEVLDCQGDYANILEKSDKAAEYVIDIGRLVTHAKILPNAILKEGATLNAMCKDSASTWLKGRDVGLECRQAMSTFSGVYASDIKFSKIWFYADASPKKVKGGNNDIGVCRMTCTADIVQFVERCARVSTWDQTKPIYNACPVEINQVTGQ